MAETCEPDLKLAAVCGLFCPGCVIYIAAHETPEKREALARARGWAVADMVCEGCRAEVRFSYCQTCTLYACATNRGLDFCGACPDYPCDDLRAFQAERPHRRELWQAQARIQEAGWQQWFAEMAEYYACPQCGTLNAAYLLACRTCGTRPSCGYVAAHQAAILEHVLAARQQHNPPGGSDRNA